ncbi:MAG: hypothetical protein ACW98X_25480, partial [Promethearchaeota archaeon]
MEEPYRIELEEESKDLKKEEGVSKNIIKWVFKNYKFLLLPGSRLDELTERETEFEKLKGKRKFIRRFKSVLTITGIIIVFFVVT